MSRSQILLEALLVVAGGAAEYGDSAAREDVDRVFEAVVVDQVAHKFLGLDDRQLAADREDLGVVLWTAAGKRGVPAVLRGFDDLGGTPVSVRPTAPTPKGR